MNVYFFCPVSRTAGDDVTKCWHTWSVGLCSMTTCTKLPICKQLFTRKYLQNVVKISTYTVVLSGNTM